MTARFALIGYPLGHSRSKELFEAKGYEYDSIPIKDLDKPTLDDILRRHPLLKGLNVTIPHKQTVVPLLDELDTLAMTVGAVNTVKIWRDTYEHVVKTKGYNTDVIGFEHAVSPLLYGRDIRGALIMGSGGASLAAQAACDRLGLQKLVVSRTPTTDKTHYSDIDAGILSSFRLIVNATPLGMWPDVQSCPPIPYHLLSVANVCFDMVYNPEETEFMRRCRRQGATVSNGLLMLQQQAQAALNIWLSND